MAEFKKVIAEIVKIDSERYSPIPTLKLTIEKGFKIENLNMSQKEILKVLQKEAKLNKFKIVVN